MITTVLFDLDDTIFDFKACEREAARRTFCHFGLPHDDAAVSLYSAINDKMWKWLEKGEITREKLRTERFAEFISIAHSDCDAVAVADYYAERLAGTDNLIDGARELLENLSSKYALYGVTNGYEFTQRGRLNASGISKYFKNVFISQFVGYVKPQKEFFDHCFSHIDGFSKANAIMVGDSISSDIKGGVAAGLKTVWFNPNHIANLGDVQPDFEISSLEELPSLIASL